MTAIPVLENDQVPELPGRVHAIVHEIPNHIVNHFEIKYPLPLNQIV